MEIGEVWERLNALGLDDNAIARVKRCLEAEILKEYVVVKNASLAQFYISLREII